MESFQGIKRAVKGKIKAKMDARQGFVGMGPNQVTSFGSDPEQAIEERIMTQKLSSKSVHDHLDAMRWLIMESNSNGGKARLSSGLNEAKGDGAGASDEWAEAFLPSVVKLLPSKHPEVRRLACTFLVRHAEARPDDALMAVNEIQKGLSNTNNPQARALSLRVLSSIRVQDITPITVIAVKGAVLDPNPVVRKAAVLALTKIFNFDHDMFDDLVCILEKVLEGEPSPVVLGAACVAFTVLCPEEVHLLHKSFRKICKLVVDMDEWSQVSALGILHRYARANFVSPNQSPKRNDVDFDNAAQAIEGAMGNLDITTKADVDSFYSDDQPVATSAAGAHSGRSEGGHVSGMTDDHKLLLRCTSSLMQSRNSAVVMAAAALQFDFAPYYDLYRLAKALVFALRTSRSSSEYVLLVNIMTLVGKHAGVFGPYIDGFFVRAADPLQVKSLKLDILTEIVMEEHLPCLLKELQAYLRDGNMVFVSKVVCALGKCARKHDGIRDRILRSLMALCTHTSDIVSSHSVQEIIGLMHEAPHMYTAQVAQLIRRYGLLGSPVARVGVIWMACCHLTLHTRTGRTEQEVRENIGEKQFQVLNELACEAARVATIGFASEHETVKVQILNTWAKLRVVTSSTGASPLLDHALALAECDESYNVRDRARFYAGLLATGNGEASEQEAGNQAMDQETVKRIILASGGFQKSGVSGLIGTSGTFSLGSLSHAVGHHAPGYRPLPDFPLESTSGHLRDPSWAVASNPSPSNGMGGQRSSFSGEPGHLQHASGVIPVAGVRKESYSRGSGQMPTGSPLDNFYSDSESEGGHADGSDSYSYYSSDEDEAQ